MRIAAFSVPAFAGEAGGPSHHCQLKLHIYMNDKVSTMHGKSYDEIAGKYVTDVYAEDPAKESRDKFIELLPSDGRVLDVGCGGGQDSAGFDSVGLAVVGIDPSERMVELSSALVPKGQFHIGGLMDVELDWDGYDGVWCARVFQHVPVGEQVEFVKRLHRVLKSGGYLYISAKLNDNELDDEVWEEEGNNKLLTKTLGSKTWPAILEDNGFEIIDMREWGQNWVESYATKRTA